MRHSARRFCAGASTAQEEALMSRLLDKASLVAVGLTLTATLFSADGSGAAAQETSPAANRSEPTQMVAQPVVQPLPAEEQVEATVQPAVVQSHDSPAATSLAALVEAQDSSDLSRELNCLAGAIYFEAKSETLEGQLAVGRVIIARSKSGRYPSSYCGVVFQPSQFSFVRGGSMPGINKASRDWREAVAIAKIADAGAWHSPVEGAISFHAASVSPGWRMKRVARLGNHVFYR
jgi:spore germination cell wall hydrolase CwlJ-like protein